MVNGIWALNMFTITRSHCVIFSTIINYQELFERSFRPSRDCVLIFCDWHCAIIFSSEVTSVTRLIRRTGNRLFLLQSKRAISLTDNFHMNLTDPPSFRSSQLTAKFSFTFIICSSHIEDYQSESLGNPSEIELILKGSRHRCSWSSWSTYYKGISVELYSHRKKSHWRQTEVPA